MKKVIFFILLLLCSLVLFAGSVFDAAVIFSKNHRAFGRYYHVAPTNLVAYYEGRYGFGGSDTSAWTDISHNDLEMTGISAPVINSDGSRHFDGSNDYFTTYAATSYAHGKGNTAFFSVIKDDSGYIWMIPYYSDDLVKVDPSDGSMTSYAHGKGNAAFLSVIKDDSGYIWMIPRGSDDLVKVDPSDGSMTSYAHGKGNDVFRSVIKDDSGYIWMIPYDSDDLVKVDPSDGSMTSYAHGKGDAAFRSVIKDDSGYIWMIPYYSDDLVKVDPNKMCDASFQITGDLTFGGSFKPTDGQPASDQVLMGKMDATNNRLGYGITLTTTGKIKITGSNDGAVNDYFITDSAVFSDGAQTDYVKIFGVYDASESNIDIYIDGSEVASTEGGDVATSIYNSSTPFMIGKSEDGEFYNGDNQSILIFNDVLSASEIQRISNKL